MKKQKRINKTGNRFGEQAENYNKYRSEYPQEFYDFIFNLSKTKKVTNVLDMGCGTGKSTEKLFYPGIKVVGCDHDSRMLNYARKNTRHHNLPIVYKKCEAENLPFKENSFDIITIGNAFHWFANKKVAKNIERILKPNGLLFIYWKQIDSEDIKLRRKIFRQFNSEYSGRGKLITSRECSELLNNYEFQKTRHLIKKYKFNYNLESAVGRLKTIGSYFNLTPKQKLEFNNIAKKVFENYISQRGKITFSPTTHICYTYKRIINLK